MNRTTLVTLFGSDSFKRTGSFELFVWDLDCIGRSCGLCLIHYKESNLLVNQFWFTKKKESTHKSHSFTLQITLAALSVFDSLLRTGSHKSFVGESDYTAGRVYDCLCRTTQ